MYYRTTDVNTKPSGEGKAKPGTGAIQSQSSKSYLLLMSWFLLMVMFCIKISSSHGFNGLCIK